MFIDGLLALCHVFCCLYVILIMYAKCLEYIVVNVCIYVCIFECVCTHTHIGNVTHSHIHTHIRNFI